MELPELPATQRPRSTVKVLGGLALFAIAALALLGVCVSTFVSSTPHRTLEVPRRDLELETPRFYPLPSFGADADGHTFGVWVVLHEAGTADAFYSQDPQSGCTLPWRPDVSFNGTFGWYRDACDGSIYSREGSPMSAAAVRGIDEFDTDVSDATVTVDLEHIRLGQCAEGTTAADALCSKAGAPARYQDKRLAFGE